MSRRDKSRLRIARATFAGGAILLSLVSGPLQAATPDRGTAEQATPGVPNVLETPATNFERFPARAAIRAIIERETASTRLPPDIAEAVAFVESRYDSTVIGGVGEIGVMQVRPETAAMLGFRGTTTELAKPDINIHYGAPALAATPAAPAPTVNSKSKSKATVAPKDVYASLRQGTPAASRAYWAVHEARIRTIKARIETKWKRVASR